MKTFINKENNDNAMRGTYIILLLLLFTLPLLSATEQSLGTFKQNECVNLLQTCSNCTFVNISSVIYPDSTQALGQVAMQKVGTEYNYTFCSTSQQGDYIVNGYADLDGINTVWNYNFTINSDGIVVNNALMFFYFLIVAGILILGFSIKEAWFVVLGGFGLMLAGMYFIINGISGFSDSLLTQGISMLILGAGMFLTIKSVMDIVNDNLN